MRTCSKCGETKAADEFCKGVKRRCLECHGRMTTEWRDRNPGYHREYYLAHRPEPTRVIAEVVDGRKPCHTCGVTKPLEDFHKQASGLGGRRTTCKACRKAAHAADPEPGRKRAAAVREKEPDYMRKWRLNNADRVAATHLRRQKRTKMTFGFSIDYIADVVVRIRQQPCHYCGGAGGEADHIVPISRGGLNHPQNLVPACRSCNASKGNRLVSEWDGPPAHRLS